MVVFLVLVEIFVVCVGVCELEVEGIGTVRASRQDIVTIKDGKVSITTREVAAQ